MLYVTANTFTSINVCLPNSKDIAVMTCISDLNCEGVGAPLLLRIIRNWKNDVRRYETWYLGVDRFFRFVTKSHLMELGEKPPYYPDFIGVLLKIKDCRKANHEPYWHQLPINLWNECITVPIKFNRNLLIPLPTITGVVVTNLKASTSVGMALPI
uniref:Uncharacterized protein n=1 Tax=Lactuca sativa TaxID=4236 RepID=A0A9R1WL99_LACSA|nr:hypothetical protein LSAT_V11C100043970 [Lactuca sativa]